MNTKNITTVAIISAAFMLGCDKPKQSAETPTPTTQASTPMENKDTPSPNISPEEKEKLKAIYDSAPARRDAVDSALSQGKPTTRVSQKNGEASKLEAILKRQGLSGHTVTEGVREEKDGGYLYKLEVIIDGVDYYVVLQTDTSLTQGTVVSKSKGSPW